MTHAELKQIRTGLGLSQQALADKLHVARNTVARWEMGLHPIPPLIADLLRRRKLTL